MANTMQRLALAFLFLLSVLCCAEAAKANAKNGMSLMTWLRSMRTKRQGDASSSDRVWTLSDAIPGEPDRDYPILSDIPNTDFSCKGRKEGYYADIGARCQVFRVCANTANDTAKGFAFLCPNGTLFNQEYFVCDWYMNVKCELSENFYNLNDQIGNSMNTASKGDLMNSAREMIMFPQQNQKPGGNNGNGGGIFNNYPTDLGSPLGINGNGAPSRGSSNLGLPTSAVGNYPYSPGAGNGGGGGGGGGPNRGANGGTVPDKDSTFDQDIRIPSNSFDTLKGIGNSYSFGFPGQNNAPTRGSADLSEPVDPSAFGNGNDQYLPPHLNGLNRKQLYTYPHDAQSHGPNNIQGILPEHTGQLNMKLAAQGPKFQAPQVYGPPAVSPPQNGQQNRFQQPNKQPPASQSRFQQPQAPPRQASQASPSRPHQPQPQAPPQKLYQQPQQLARPNGQNHQQNGHNQHQNGQNQPARLYQQPNGNQQAFRPQSQQPQPFRAQQNPNQQFERRQFNGAPSGGAPNRNGFQNGQQQNGQRSSPHHQQPSNGNRNGNNKQSNEEYLRGLLKDKTHIHNDKVQLVELIQRLFVPASSKSRVVSAEVIPSQASESYSFTYDGQGAPSNTKSNYQPAHSGFHQHKHTGTCGHTNQGY